MGGPAEGPPPLLGATRNPPMKDHAPLEVKRALSDPGPPIGSLGSETPSAPYVFIKCVNGPRGKALIDSGNLFGDVVSEEFYDSLPNSLKGLKPSKVKTVNTAKKSQGLEVVGQMAKSLNFRFCGHPTIFSFRPTVLKNLSMPVNLGFSFMTQAGLVLRPHCGELLVQGRAIPLPEVGTRGGSAIGAVYVAKDVLVPPLTGTTIPGRVVNPGSTTSFPAGLLEGSESFAFRTQLQPWGAVVIQPSAKGEVPLGVINTTAKPIKVKRGTRYGLFTADDPAKGGVHILDGTFSEDPTGVLASLGTSRDPEDDNDNSATGVETEDEKIKTLTEAFGLQEKKLLSSPLLLGQAVALLLKYYKVFSWDGKPGKTTLIEHDIRLKPGTQPYRAKCRPVNPALEAKLKQALEDWKAQGVIVPSTSDWASPLVLVLKKDGGLRVCVDFRRLNKDTIRDNFDIGDAQALLSRLHGARVFSCVDHYTAFHNVVMAPGARKLTGFTSPFGPFEFNRMPFGLCGAPQTYARLVEKILEGIPRSVALPFLDDCIVHSRTVEEHFGALEQVLAAFLRSGIKLKPSKCAFFTDRVKFLGHHVDEQGLSVDPAYVQAVAAWPMPNTRKRVRIFMGKANYYRRFIKEYQRIANPLSELLKQDGRADNAEFVPTEEQEKSFKDLKAALCSAPILSLPDFDPAAEPFILDTDYSCENACIGAVLSQKQNGLERPLMYHSLRLQPSQANYTSFKGELFAGLTFMNRLRYYLLGRKFIWRTDCAALTQVRTMEAPNGLIGRWMEALCNFDFVVVHRAGKSHGNADSLSRADHITEMVSEAEATDHPDSVTLASLLIPRGGEDIVKSMAEWREEQDNDEDLRLIRQWVSNKIEPTPEQMKGLPRSGQFYASVYPDLHMDGQGVLRWKRHFPQGSPSGPAPTTRSVILVPEALKLKVVRLVHESSHHRGRDETTTRAQRLFYFPRMSEAAREVISACHTCQGRKEAPKKQMGELLPSSVGYPFQKLSIDFVGPLPPSPGGHRYIFTVMDVFSRWLEAFPVQSATSKVAIKKLTDEIFCRYGLPHSVHSDRGTTFTSNEFREFLRDLKVGQSVTPAYNPKSNPVERAHRTLNSLLAKLVGDSPSKWAEVLPIALHTMRTSVCRMTGQAPYKVLFGTDPPSSLELLFGDPNLQAADITASTDTKQRIMEAQAWARSNMAAAINRSRRAYLGKLPKYPDGSKVWLFTPVVGKGQSKKFTQFWSGPWTIVRCINPATYEIAPHPTWVLNEPKVVSVDRLKVFRSAHDDDLDQINRPPPIGVDLSMTGDEFAESIAVDCPERPVALPQAYRNLPGPIVPRAALQPAPANIQGVPPPPPAQRRPRRRQIDILLEEAARFGGNEPPPRRARVDPQAEPPGPIQEAPNDAAADEAQEEEIGPADESFHTVDGSDNDPTAEDSE